MADMILTVDTALTEVPVNIMPLVDDGDFKTIEGAVAYNAAGMALRHHFVTVAGVYTVTSVTPTSGGDYDWTDHGDSGIYTIEIPASGGASINNDQEGHFWFTGVATGILPWRSPVFQVSPAHIAHGLVTGTEFFRVDAHNQEFTVTGTTLQTKKPDGSTNTDYSRTLGTDVAAEPIISST